MWLAVRWPVWTFRKRERRPTSVFDVRLMITSAIPVIFGHWHGHRDVVALPFKDALEAMNETFQAATFSLMLASMLLSPFTEQSFKNTLRRKLLNVEFQTSKLQRPDSCAKRREIESCRRLRR
jgi:hypothetical protein